MPSKLFVISTAFFLSACSSLEVESYRAEQPEFTLESYFDGQIDAWGMFQKRNGEVVKRFKVEIEAKWEGKEGVLDERFLYSDGATQRRIWKITRIAPGRYQGKADDVIGIAQGESAGNALRWVYRLRLPVDGKVWEVDFDDWMYLQRDGVLINRSVMKKWGIRIGEVTLFFRKRQ